MVPLQITDGSQPPHPVFNPDIRQQVDEYYRGEGVTDQDDSHQGVVSTGVLEIRDDCVPAVVPISPLMVPNSHPDQASVSVFQWLTIQATQSSRPNHPALIGTHN